MKQVDIPNTLVKNLYFYCEERFPPIAYTVLVGLFFWSSMIVFELNPSNSQAWLGGIVMWLVFFHLRIFDEHKDYREDRWIYPDRILSKGWVQLSLLGRVSAAVIVLEAILSLMIGPSAFLYWGILFLFSLLMRYEFGLGHWLEQRKMLYAITHNPIVALLAIYAWSCTDSSWNIEYIWYVLSISLGSFAFELARKMNQKEEEIPGRRTYSSVYGLERMLLVLRMVLLLASVCTAIVLLFLHSSAWGWGILGLATTTALYLTHPQGNAKKFELSGTLFLLLSMISMIVAPF